jgi:hypothetical protein
MGFSRSRADAGLYKSTGGGSPIYLLVYVDDILAATSSLAASKAFTSSLLSAFDGRDLGPATFFLGMAINRDRASRTIKITQGRMVSDLLAKYKMDEAKPRLLPLSPAERLSAFDGEPLDHTVYRYSEAIGSLNYLALCSRVDIAAPVSKLASFNAKPTTAHWAAVKGVLRYLKGTADFGITYGSKTAHSGELGSSLLGFGDANYAGDLDTRRSTTGFVFTLAGGAISWSSKLQATVAASTTEAEYIAAASTIKEALWLRNVLTDLGLRIETVPLFTDNQAALKLLRNPLSSHRSKHIDVAHHFSRERVARKEVSFSYLPTDQMLADMLTKALPAAKLQACCAGIGLA